MALLKGSEKNDTMQSATVSPISSMPASSSLVAVRNLSKLPKCEAQSFEVRFPTFSIPSANMKQSRLHRREAPIEAIRLSAFFSFHPSSVRRLSFVSL